MVLAGSGTPARRRLTAPRAGGPIDLSLPSRKCQWLRQGPAGSHTGEETGMGERTRATGGAPATTSWRYPE